MRKNIQKYNNTVLGEAFTKLLNSLHDDNFGEEPQSKPRVAKYAGGVDLSNSKKAVGEPGTSSNNNLILNPLRA